MNHSIAIVGRWHEREDGELDAVFDFDSDGRVEWSGQSEGRAFQCKGVYQLDESSHPATLQVANVEIIQIDTHGGPVPVVEEGIVLRFYQEFLGENVMRMRGMAVNPGNEEPSPAIEEGPTTMTLMRQ